MGALFGGGGANRARRDAALQAQQQANQFAQQNAASERALAQQRDDIARSNAAFQEASRLNALQADKEKRDLLEGSKRFGGGFFGASSSGTFLGGSGGGGTYL